MDKGISKPVGAHELEPGSLSELSTGTFALRSKRPCTRSCGWCAGARIGDGLIDTWAGCP